MREPRDMSRLAFRAIKPLLPGNMQVSAREIKIYWDLRGC
jgi:hypothetical protein